MTRAAADRLDVERISGWQRDGAVVLYKDCCSVWHKVQIVSVGPRMTTITYLDNARRGTTYYSGRRYNHATRVTICAYNNQLVTTGGAL